MMQEDAVSSVRGQWAFVSTSYYTRTSLNSGPVYGPCYEDAILFRGPRKARLFMELPIQFATAGVM